LLEQEGLFFRIELLRKELNALGENLNFNLQHQEMLQKSVELDQLIVQYYKNSSPSLDS